MDQAPIVVPRGFSRGLWQQIWSEMEVGFGLLDNGNRAAMKEDNSGRQRKGIGRVWWRIGGVWKLKGIV